MGKWNRNRVDDNQREIVKQLRAMPGVTVAVDHDDLIVGFRGRNWWFEVKNPDTVSKVTGKVQPSKLKKAQHKLRQTWQGQYDVVWTVEQILKIITGV